MLALLLTLQAATPAMAPPPPLPISDCFAPGPFIIFFPKGSATLTDEARSILAALVAREADPCGVFRLGIVGTPIGASGMASTAAAPRRCVDGWRVGGCAR